MSTTINIQEELKVARKKNAKPMLLISLISLTMMFAGLISAYVISSKREDWVSFELPNAIYTSTIAILLSSISIHAALFFNKKENKTLATTLLLVTLVLGLTFIKSQFDLFAELKEAGLFFTGTGSQVSSSMLMVIVFAHLLHIFAAIIVILVMIYKQITNSYTKDNLLGQELGTIFWHFLDLLWIILFLFFYFNS